MKVITLKRLFAVDGGIFGYMVKEDGHPISCTGELSWQANQHDISCIPIGEYTCQRGDFGDHGKIFQVLNVPNRDGILIHKGNIPHVDSKGCILLGAKIGELNGITSILESQEGFDRFMEYLAGEANFKLIITNA